MPWRWTGIDHLSLPKATLSKQESRGGIFGQGRCLDTQFLLSALADWKEIYWRHTSGFDICLGCIVRQVEYLVGACVCVRRIWIWVRA